MSGGVKLNSSRDSGVLTKENTKLSGISANGGQTANGEEEQHQLNQPSVRNILGFLDKYDRVEIQELLSQMNCHWLLSTEDFKIPIEHPVGIINQMPPLGEDSLILLIPYEPDIPCLDYREMHQIIRELTIGMYVFNQPPALQLETNFDESTSCQLPPAYIDTKLGQIMINTDYWLKALWHGAYFPREKRIKFSERWRQLLDVDSNGVPQTKKSIFLEFINAGLTDISKDSDYSSIFNTDNSNSNNETNSNSIGFGVNMSANNSVNNHSSASSYHAELAEMLNITEEQVKEEINFFMTYIDDISLQMNFGLKSIKHYKNMYELDADYEISSCFRADNQRVDNQKFERMKPIINSHEKYLRESFSKKDEIKKNLCILKIVSFLVPVFIGFKKRMKIPDMNNLLPLMTGDEVHTERELPPLMLGHDFKSKRFSKFTDESTTNHTHHHDPSSQNQTENQNNNQNQNKYFNLHGGIQFELETTSISSLNDENIESEYPKISQVTARAIKSYLESEQQFQEYKIPVVTKNNKKYWSLKLDLEGYYGQSPQKPYWVLKLNEDLTKLKPKRLPMTDIQIYDLCKKHFGYKKATKFKSLQAGLRASAQRGTLSIFQSYTRKTPANRLSKQDEFGLAFMHYSAIFNRPLIISSLIMISIDANVKQQIDYMAIGPMPLHYAARCGSLDSVSCLLSNYANISFADHEGWGPIHHACYFDNVPVIRLLIRRQYELIEMTTRTESRKTPLLVAASSGSLEAVKCLISLGANISFQDENGYNIIHIAAHRNHTNIIDYFISNPYPQLKTWNLLINMLSSEKIHDKEASVKCLQLLTNHNKKFWSAILNAGGIEKLFALLRSFGNVLAPSQNQPAQADSQSKSLTKMIQPTTQPPDPAKAKAVVDKSNINITHEHESIILNAISVLCNLSDQPEIKQCLSKIPDLCSVIMKLIEYSTNSDMKSRVAILIADVASVEEKIRQTFVEQECLDKLLILLNSEYEDLLVNTVNAIEIICKDNKKNQDYVCENGILESFINLLDLNSDLLRSSVAAAISAITNNNPKNQIMALRQGLIKPLIDLLKSRNMTVQLKVALALESLAVNNQMTQEAILAYDAASYMIRLLEDHTTIAAIFEYRKGSNHQAITLNIEFYNYIHSKVLTLELKDFVSAEILLNNKEIKPIRTRS